MFRPLAGVVVLCLCLLLAPAARAEPVEFIALGDMPYGEDQVKSLAYIGNQIRKGGYPFVIHYGDIKAGDGACSDALLSERRKIVYGLLEGRVFYTPGDNDWTDCDRKEAGSFDEMERLRFLRRLFFTDGLPSIPDWRIRRQAPGYPENAHWEWEGLLFVTLHIVGSDNGRHEIKNSDVAAALDAVDARDQANLVWLDLAFERARLSSAVGLVAIIHADPYEIEHRAQRNQPCTKTLRTDCNPYLPFLERLTEQADRFDKPVLLIHGSTNKFCLDRGFGGWRAQKLWRLNGPGDFVTVDAAVVTFDPAAREPFAVHGLLSGDSLPACLVQ
ncbi:MAG: hypothetical protein ACFCUQ_23130 [Kiloniellales bacterium]